MGCMRRRGSPDLERQHRPLLNVCPNGEKQRKKDKSKNNDLLGWENSENGRTLSPESILYRLNYLYPVQSPPGSLRPLYSGKNATFQFDKR